MASITSASALMQPTLRFVFSHPAHFIAFGFGTGLSRIAPGTLGTLVALPLYLALSMLLPDKVLLPLIVGLFFLGVWACEVTGRHLGVHDHSGMVWDEIVAFMAVLFFVPPLLMWQAFAFLLFRLFDILKPPPIRSVDRDVRNGFGVMFDDAIAALYALLCLALWRLVFG